MNPKQTSGELQSLFRKMKLEKSEKVYTDLDAETDGSHVTTPRRGSKTRSVVWTGSTGMLFVKDNELGKDDDFGKEEHDGVEQAWPEGRPDDGTIHLVTLQIC